MAEHSFRALMAALPSNLESRLLQLISESLLSTGPGFGADSDLFAAGLDSMAIMQLLLLVEEEFGVAIPAESVSRENFSTVATLARLLRQRAGEPEPEPATEPDTGSEQAATPAPEAPFSPPVALEGRILETFERLPLVNCDFFVLAFDTMMRDAGQGGHVAHSFVELESAPDIPRLRDALATAARKHALLNAKLRRRWLVGLPEWVPAKEPQVPELLLFSEDGSPGALLAHGAQRCADPQTTSEDVINTPLPPETPGAWPKCRFSVIERRDGSCRLIFSWSHLMVDGVGAELLLDEVDAIASDGARPGIPPIEIPPSDGRHYGQRWANTTPMVNYFYNLLKKPFDCLGARKLTKSRTKFRIFEFDAEQTRTVAARAAGLCGPLINMPFHLGVAMRAHDHVFALRGKRPESLICNVPVQQRRKGARGPIFQNHLGMFFGALAADEMGTLDAAVKRLMEQHAQYLKEKLDGCFDDLMNVMRPMPPRLHMKFIHWHMKGLFTSLFHSHTGEFASGLETFLGARIRTAFHVPGFSNPPGTGLFCNEKFGKLVVTQCWSEGALSEPERAAMIHRLAEDYGVAL